MRVALVLFLTFCALAAAMSARAEPRQYGNVIYDPPAAWTQGGIRYGARVLLHEAPDDRCEFCYVYIGLGAPKSGSLPGFLQFRATGFVDDEDRAAVEVMQAPSLTRLGSHNAALMGIKTGSDFQILVGIELSDRYEVLVFEGAGYDEADLTAAMAVFQDEVVGMIEGLSFVSEGADPLMPDPEPGDMDGLWWGWRTGFTMQLDGTMQMQVQQRHIVFWPDGHFFDGTPPMGLAPIDAPGLTDLGGTDFGTYTVSGDTLTLSFMTGEVETLTRDGDGWAEGDRVLARVEPLVDGERIDGYVSSFFYSGFTPGSGVTGGVTSSSSTAFRPDGTYTGESFGGAFGNFENGAGDLTGGFATDSGTDARGGTYEIADGMLIQTPSDGGPKLAEMIFRGGGDIIIGDQFLKTGDE
jgi:hypothetical protein